MQAQLPEGRLANLYFDYFLSNTVLTFIFKLLFVQYCKGIEEMLEELNVEQVNMDVREDTNDDEDANEDEDDDGAMDIENEMMNNGDLQMFLHGMS